MLMKKLADSKGFTLIELLIVIAIIAILASIAIPQYMKYQRKAKVSSYVEPIVRACVMDIAAYCIENPGTNLSSATLKNCENNQVTPGGTVSLNISAPSCDSTGSLVVGSGSVTGQLTTITDYTAKCTVQEGGFKCTVE